MLICERKARPLLAKFSKGSQQHDKLEVEEQFASDSERNSKPRGNGATDVRQGWSGEAAEPLYSNKKGNGTQGTCGDI